MHHIEKKNQDLIPKNLLQHTETIKVQLRYNIIMLNYSCNVSTLVFLKDWLLIFIMHIIFKNTENTKKKKKTPKLICTN